MDDRLVSRQHPQPESQPQQQPSTQRDASNTLLSTPQPVSSRTAAVAQREERIFLNATDPASIARISLLPEPSKYSPCETLQGPDSPGIAILPRRTRPAPISPPPTPVQVNNTWRRETYNNKRDATISWLNNAWGGPSWIPRDIRQGDSKPGVQVVIALKDITLWAQARNLDLHSLWNDGSVLRQAVSRDYSERIQNRKPRSRSAVPRLTAAIAKSTLEVLSRSDDAPQWAAATIHSDDESFIPHESEPSIETSTLASEVDTIRMPPTQEASADTDMTGVPETSLKRRSPGSTLVPTPAAKKLRTAALHTARQIFKVISSHTPMSSDIIDFLGRVISDQGPAQHGVVGMHWAGVVRIHPDSPLAAPARVTAFSADKSVAVAILTVVPFEHWCLGTLSLIDKAVQLQLHGGRPSQERSRLIHGYFEELMSSSSHKGSLKLSILTCPPLDNDDSWSSGLHALSCFSRIMNNKPCINTAPFNAAGEQTALLNFLLNAYSHSHTKDDASVLAALRFHKLETELANIPTEEVDHRRKDAQAYLDKVKATGKVEEEVYQKMVAEYERKKQESDKGIQVAQQRVDSLVHLHDAKIMLAQHKEKVKLRKEAEEKVRLLEEQLTKAKGERSLRLEEEAALEHQEHLVDTRAGDWKVHLAGVQGLFGEDGGE